MTGDPPALVRRWLAFPLALVLFLAGCTAAAEPAAAPDEQASPFADCATLTAAPPSAAVPATALPSAAVPSAAWPSAGLPPAGLPPAALSSAAPPPAALSSAAPPSASPPSAAVPSAALPSAAPSTSARTNAGLPDLELPCFTGGRPVRLAALHGPAVINLWASWCEPCRTELPVMQGLADRADGRLHVVGVDTGDGRDAAASFGAGKNISMPTLYDRDRELLAALGRINLPITIFVDSAGRDYVHALPLDAYGLAQLVREHTGVAVAP